MFLGLKKKIKDELAREEKARQVPISVADMYATEQAAFDEGVDVNDLMLAAGQAIANIVHQNYADAPVVVLCGSGNNGGDGYVAGRLLTEMGHDVTLYALKPVRNLKGPAKVAAKMWAKDHPVKKLKSFTENDIASGCVVIDAVFGIGFSGVIQEPLILLFRKVNEAGCPVVAADVPSGVNADTGEVAEQALKADHTVTFFRPKQGMFKEPAKHICGNISVHDIGIDDKFLSSEEKSAD